jgi:hypothetical protein
MSEVPGTPPPVVNALGEGQGEGSRRQDSSR